MVKVRCHHTLEVYQSHSSVFDARVNITDVTFIGNTGNDGGNLHVASHIITSYPSTTLPEPLLTVDRCLFKQDHGLVGGGIYMFLKEYQNLGKTNQLQILL